MYNSCVIGMMLSSSECWALRQKDKRRLKHSESNALMDVKHQERTTCQHKFPPKLIETEKPGFSVML